MASEPVDYSHPSWKRWPLGAEVTNGTQHGVIVRSDYMKRGSYLPMVSRVGGPVEKVWPWETPRWRLVSDRESEAAHQLHQEQLKEADYASDVGDNMRSKDGKVLMPRWSPESARRIRGTVRPMPDRGLIERDDSNPFE